MPKHKFVNAAGKTAYELMVILPHDLGEEENKKQLAGLKKLIAEREGDVTHEDSWGTREFCYPIKKREQGFYYIINFDLPGKFLSDLNKNLRLNTTLLRFLIVNTPASYKPVDYVAMKDQFGLEVNVKELMDIDRPQKKRKDKFDQEKPAAPNKFRATTPAPTTSKPASTPVAKVEAPKPAPKPAAPKKVLEEKPATPVKETPSVNDNAEERLAELDRKLDELLNQDL